MALTKEWKKNKPAPDPSKISVIIMDLDGVWTNGSFGYGCGSDQEMKFFYSRDGIGIRLLKQFGFKVGIITGRSCMANECRANELGVDFLKQFSKKQLVKNKLETFMELLTELNVTPENCLYVGDDIIDLPVMHRVAIACAPGDSAEDVLADADWITKAAGGRGAIREMVERLFKARGLWDEVLRMYE